MSILPGYYRRLNAGWEVKVACNFCQQWHTHGASPVRDREVGELMHKANHCNSMESPYSIFSGYVIRIQPEEFDNRWLTKHGKFSKAFTWPNMIKVNVLNLRELNWIVGDGEYISTACSTSWRPGETIEQVSLRETIKHYKKEDQ